MDRTMSPCPLMSLAPSSLSPPPLPFPFFPPPPKCSASARDRASSQKKKQQSLSQILRKSTVIYIPSSQSNFEKEHCYIYTLFTIKFLRESRVVVLFKPGSARVSQLAPQSAPPKKAAISSTCVVLIISSTQSQGAGEVGVHG